MKRTEITRVQELIYELKLQDVMTKRLATVTPDTSMAELREVLRINRISGTPVVENGRMVGDYQSGRPDQGPLRGRY